MATREKITAETFAVNAKLLDLQQIYMTIKDAGDKIIYIGDNQNLPVTVRDAQRDVFRANFDRIKEEVKALVAAW